MQGIAEGWGRRQAVRRASLLAAALWLAAGSTGFASDSSAPKAAKEIAEIAAFNQKFMDAGLHMDNAAVMACYADDGVSLLPGMAAMEGKKTIAKWLDGLVAEMPGFHVVRNDFESHDLRIAGDWASEWVSTHQVVQPPGDKPPLDNWGKMLLVLHRQKSGEWVIEQEMWNSAPAPAGH
jgi:uncharacterized protein (TIGR02246 family)